MMLVAAILDCGEEVLGCLQMEIWSAWMPQKDSPGESMTTFTLAAGVTFGHGPGVENTRVTPLEKLAQWLPWAGFKKVPSKSVTVACCDRTRASGIDWTRRSPI